MFLIYLLLILNGCWVVSKSETLDRYPKEITKLFVEASTKDNIQPRIMGGKSCHVKDYNFFVSIQVKSKLNQFEHRCGGSVVREHSVVTSGYCCKAIGKNFTKDSVRIVAGEDKPYRQKRFDDEKNFSSVRENLVRSPGRNMSEGEQRALANSSIFHPNYTSTTPADVCMVTLQSGIKETFFVGYVNLAKKSDCGKATALGFGVQDSKKGISKYVNQLQCLDFTMGATPECQVNLSQNMVPNTLCGTPEKPGKQNTCQFDEGGPLVCDDQLVGIIKQSEACDATHRLFTRSDIYREWILNTAEEIEEEYERSLMTSTTSSLSTTNSTSSSVVNATTPTPVTNGTSSLATANGTTVTSSTNVTTPVTNGTQSTINGTSVSLSTTVTTPFPSTNITLTTNGTLVTTNGTSVTTNGTSVTTNGTLATTNGTLSTINGTSTTINGTTFSSSTNVTTSLPMTNITLTTTNGTSLSVSTNITTPLPITNATLSNGTSISPGITTPMPSTSSTNETQTSVNSTATGTPPKPSVILTSSQTSTDTGSLETITVVYGTRYRTKMVYILVTQSEERESVEGFVKTDGPRSSCEIVFYSKYTFCIHVILIYFRMI